jgi:hypothetical protein
MQRSTPVVALAGIACVMAVGIATYADDCWGQPQSASACCTTPLLTCGGETGAKWPCNGWSSGTVMVNGVAPATGSGHSDPPFTSHVCHLAVYTCGASPGVCNGPTVTEGECRDYQSWVGSNCWGAGT